MIGFAMSLLGPVWEWLLGGVVAGGLILRYFFVKKKAEIAERRVRDYELLSRIEEARRKVDEKNKTPSSIHTADDAQRAWNGMRGKDPKS